MESDAVYYRRRALEERQAAFSAPRGEVRDRHLEFAHAYDLRARFLLREAARPETIVEDMLIIR